MDEVEKVFSETEEHMKKSIELVEAELSSVRTGKASPTLLDSVKVDYYGSTVPLKQIANIAVPDAKLLTVQPWEKSMVGEVVKAIQSSNLGLNPQSDGTFIRIPLPLLTEDRRHELVKTVKHMVEEGRIAIRNIRREANEKMKKLEKSHEISEDNFHKYHKEIQEMTDKSILELDNVSVVKEKEIMEF
ncbi:MAG: ribosome recycling factor [Candidatus Krumholzibacteriota bacterium]|nr:ribosome recycling factor [Candidatus Krumholzibacteriota bacterium]